jgi:lipopolysaccharide export LptBFGC system permease protein LptF
MPILPGNVGNLPRLGFGLWQIRTGSILAELLLVILGAFCYWRAAAVVTAAAQKGRTRATITAILILLCGIAVLALDVTGWMG